MHDELGDRMKENYEDRTRTLLPRRTYTILRVDGKAFHTVTKNCEKPFDAQLMRDMDSTAIYLCQNIQGAQFAYVQSDEISILVTDFMKKNTDAYFDGNIQKICSVTASMAAAKFNYCRSKTELSDAFKSWEGFVRAGIGAELAEEPKLAAFDCRVFTIPDPVEVTNYFIWRNNDASRNSVQMVTRAFFSHKECEGKGISEMHDMLYSIEKNWATDYTDGEKNGRLIVKALEPGTFFGKDGPVYYTRNVWVSCGAEPFSKNPKRITDLIPKMGYE
jgi:tRNA(His) guanylyltransferase